MNIGVKDFEIIEFFNKQFPRYGLPKISVDEYFFASELSSNKLPIKVIENLILSRCQEKINNGEIKDLSVDLYSYSITLMTKYKESAINLRRYAHQFRSIEMAISSDIQWSVRYLEDKDCKECAYLSRFDHNIENEINHASCPVESCTLPFNICRNGPVYISHRDKEGNIIKHNKDYSQLLKIKFTYDEY